MGGYKTKERNKAIKLFNEGMTMKLIGEKLQVRAQTVSEWLKPIIKAQKTKTEVLENLNNRLLQLTENPNTPLSEIKEITDLIKEIKNN